MDEDDIKKLARKSGMTGREMCLKEIEKWQKRLAIVSNDYRGLSDEEFKKRVENEIEARQQD